jgi:DNA-directed RNA polymerase specialized sigma24 family protein
VRHRRYVAYACVGLFYQEIAECECVAHRAVDKQLAEARRRLRELRDQAA